MTEEEWATCTDPTPMIEALRGKASDRKLRLFACGCCRQCRRVCDDEHRHKAVAVAEHYADGSASVDDLNATRDELIALYGESAMEPVQTVTSSGSGPEIAENTIWAIGELAILDSSWYRSQPEGRFTRKQRRHMEGIREATQRAQANLIRCIFGNPFRPVALDPAWRTSDVVALARGIYEEQAFDWMPILADALQDAGCTNEDVLNHCRDANQVHVRGCWVVDLLLGKG